MPHFDVVFTRFDVVEPDLLYLSNERAAEVLTSKNVQGVPNLVIEILSKGTRRRDETLKRRLYERSAGRVHVHKGSSVAIGSAGASFQQQPDDRGLLFARLHGSASTPARRLNSQMQRCRAGLVGSSYVCTIVDERLNGRQRPRAHGPVQGRYPERSSAFGSAPAAIRQLIVSAYAAGFHRFASREWS